MSSHVVNCADALAQTLCCFEVSRRGTHNTLTQDRSGTNNRIDRQDLDRTGGGRSYSLRCLPLRLLTTPQINARDGANQLPLSVTNPWVVMTTLD